jgi:hypothetical protein
MTIAKRSRLGMRLQVAIAAGALSFGLEAAVLRGAFGDGNCAK